MWLRNLRVWQIHRTDSQGNVLVRSLTIAANHAQLTQPHIYKKSFTPAQLIQYLKDNVVYENSNLLVTSVPHGVNFHRYNKLETFQVPPVCDFCFSDIRSEIRKAFQLENLFLLRFPKSASSGVTLFAKDFDTYQKLSAYMKSGIPAERKEFSYLVVALGFPQKKFSDTYYVKRFKSSRTHKIFTASNNPNGYSLSLKTKYRHEVVDEAEDVSLVKVTVSSDRENVMRQILSQECFAPILGDPQGVFKARNVLFGFPLLTDEPETGKLYTLRAEVLEKLQLSAGEENCIPFQSHLYSVKMPLDMKSELFVSATPSESFIWTCNQFGLKKIDEFIKPLPESSSCVRR